jgi:hypothetical protein
MYKGRLPMKGGREGRLPMRSRKRSEEGRLSRKGGNKGGHLEMTSPLSTESMTAW